jgi:putative membrane protein
VFKLTKIAVIGSCTIGALAAQSNRDQNFVNAASQGGIAEVKLGQLAAGKAQNPKVREFGQKMVDDHSKANNELAAIVQRKNLTAPSGLTSKDQALMDRLQGLSGAAFDKAYMSSMVKDHETDIADFEKEANSGSDEDFKNFAAKTLPTLREHLSMAKQDATTMGVSQ